MNGRILCLAALIFLCSCARHDRETVPELTMTRVDRDLPARCAALFPVGEWQFVHAIAFHMADGRNGSAIGVLVLSDGEIRCALTTVEGLTLFEATLTAAGLDVHRALPPFASTEFAAGMMDDIRTIFRLPAGTARFGLLDGNPVCRHVAGERVTDIEPQADGCWSLAVYQGRFRSRSIQAASCRQVEGFTIPGKLALAAAGPAGYTLNMQLLSAERLSSPVRKTDP
jgi:hypothetical protein